MKNKHTLWLLFTFLFFGINQKLQAQQLTPGDIAFVGFNSENPDAFAIITLTDIAEGKIIYFTDNGWLASGNLRKGEGTISWTAPAGGVLKGTVIKFFDDTNWQTSVGTVSGAINPTTDGDQILAFTGNENSPNFIAAIQFDASGWTDATSPETTALPPGLTDDSTAVAIPETDNAIYCGPTTGIKTELLFLINNPENWYGNNNQRFNLAPDLYPFDVFSGTASTYWNTVTNWLTLTLPDATKSIIIPNGKTAKIAGLPTAYCKNIFIESDGYLIVDQGQSLQVENNLFIQSSTITKTGGINCSGNVKVNGSSTVERYIPGNGWHIISSPVKGQTIGTFAVNPDNSIQYNSSFSDYDLAPYNELSDEWSPYTPETNTTNLETAKGYVMRRTETGNVVFIGQLTTNDTIINIVRNNHGWNCIGNPFPSAIKGTGTGSFLTENMSQLDTAFTALYVWDESEGTEGDYLTYTASNTNKIAIAQGFIVKSKTGGATVNFSNDLVTYISGSFKSVETEPAFIQLTAKTDSFSNSTEFYFNPEMTTGLDPMYDAGKLKGNPDFSLYTKLVNDNGYDYAVQALPDYSSEGFRIPIGIDFKNGGEVSFSAVSSNLPPNFKIILEDSETNSFTPLDTEGSTYSTQITAGNTGTGRFYILTNENLITKTVDFDKEKISAFCRDKTIFINGHIQEKTRFILYGIDGKIHLIQKSKSIKNNKISISHVPVGMYLLKFENRGKPQTIKVVISQ